MMLSRRGFETVYGGDPREASPFRSSPSRAPTALPRRSGGGEGDPHPGKAEDDDRDNTDVHAERRLDRAVGHAISMPTTHPTTLARYDEARHIATAPNRMKIVPAADSGPNTSSTFPTSPSSCRRALSTNSSRATGGAAATATASARSHGRTAGRW